MQGITPFPIELRRVLAKFVLDFRPHQHQFIQHKGKWEDGPTKRASGHQEPVSGNGYTCCLRRDLRSARVHDKNGPMQTLEFARALREIVKDLRIAELLQLLGPFLVTTPSGNQIPESTKTQFSALLFSSNAAYQSLLQRKTARAILEQFQVSQFYEPDRLRAMLTTISNSGQYQQILNSPPNYAQFYTFAAQLRSLTLAESACSKLLEQEKIGQIPASDGILEVELIEYADEVGISPKRLETFVSSIIELHTNLAMILGVNGDKLTFKFFDSGSGFLVGIQCAKIIVDALNTLLNQWWEKIRFWRFDTFEKRMDAISKGLNAADLVRQSVEKGTINQETADNLKVRIFREVDNLVGIGATVPLGDNVTVDQQQLLTEMRNTKLLGTGAPATDEQK